MSTSDHARRTTPSSASTSPAAPAPAPAAPAASFSLLNPAQMCQAAEDAAYAKATSRPGKSFLLGITAGAYIALGFVFFVTSQVGSQVMPWGVAKVLGGLVFSTGLGLVVLTGAELFTSSTLTLMAKASGRITWGQLLRNWGVVYVANFLGSLLMAGLIYAAGTWRNADGGWGAVVLKTTAAKLHHGWVEAFVLGILCNLLVCLAVWAAYSGRTAVDKLAAITLPIALFVATGFEHSVANMFMIPLGLLVNSGADAAFWSAAHLDPATFAGLSWSQFFTANLIPVTLGNIVGGGLMVGMYQWVIYRYYNAPKSEAHTL
ncbi:formate transporter FocA [Mobilicoccus pelagius]|uniref:Putative formate/nitrite transporter n=1 Tax=Mobilicoccus pelagius NBRC 104925 TaxID=1089455 RepID=H5USL6_9MICO|nr:formate transporter FocA [Mobilicoccus pelagius]GAB48724.1 putative formate/nitrite transporter [Mobilicoccus pelagius NBRC 104925]